MSCYYDVARHELAKSLQVTCLKAADGAAFHLQVSLLDLIYSPS